MVIASLNYENISVFTLKEANETSYWLLLLAKANIITSDEYNRLENLCREIRVTLIASINTAKGNTK